MQNYLVKTAAVLGIAALPLAIACSPRVSYKCQTSGNGQMVIVNEIPQYPEYYVDFDGDGKVDKLVKTYILEGKLRWTEVEYFMNPSEIEKIDPLLANGSLVSRDSTAGFFAQGQFEEGLGHCE